MRVVKLELKPEVESTLAARARERGVSLDVYLQNVIEDLARAQDLRSPSLREFRAALDALADLGRNLAPLPSADLRRESIYQDHD